MRVLSIGSDRSVFEKGSEARARQRAYALALGAMDLIVFTTEPFERIVDGTLTIIPTNSSSRWKYVSDALGHARYIERPDVVTVQDPFESGFAGAKVAKRIKVPLHVQVHTDFANPEFTKGSLLNRIRIFLARPILKRATRVRAVSERVRAQLISRYRLKPERISVLPIFIDTERYRVATVTARLEGRFKQFSKVLLLVARLEPEKNIDLAISAFLSAAPKDACLIVLGTGSLENTLRERYRFESTIYFEGRQDPAPYYKLADLTLVTSRYEGYGRTIIESLAAGTPVLSTPVGIAEEAGATITEPESFAGALAKWLVDGPFEGTLTSYPYKSFDDYVVAYRDDLAACVRK